MDILLDPRNNRAEEFIIFSKSKMAAAAITANYEIAHNLKSIQLRYPIFFPRPMFSRVRNTMKLSFALLDLSNYLKIQNGRRNWRFQTYSRGALYFFFQFSQTHVFKGKECNEAIICVLRSQQLPQNSKWPSKLAFLDLFARRLILLFYDHSNYLKILLGA